MGSAIVDGVDTAIVTFHVRQGRRRSGTASGDDDDRVRRAEMHAQGHVMAHRYRDVDAPIAIEPPT